MRKSDIRSGCHNYKCVVFVFHSWTNIILITVIIRDIRELRISVENELKESEEEAEMLADAKLRFLLSIVSSIIHCFH